MNYVPTWQLCKVIYGNRGVNAISLLPLFAYLLFFSESLTSYLASLDWSIETSGSVFNDYLRRIFLGLFCILVGLFIYLTSCPWEVRVFKDHVDYAEEQKKNFTPVRLQQMAKKLRDGRRLWIMLPNEVASRIEKLNSVDFEDMGLSGDAQTLMEETRDLSRDGYVQKFGLQINEIFDLWYEVHTRIRTIPRIISLVFGVLGYLVLVYPSAKIIWTVFLGFGNDLISTESVNQ